jgi:Bacterial protein of unknown function (DUF899)
MTTAALPPIVDADAWQRELDALRAREKAATRELDAIAAQRRRLPMVKMPGYTLEGEQGPVRLADVFDGTSQLIIYNHMWSPGERWQCPGCTGFTSQFTRLEFLDAYGARTRPRAGRGHRPTAGGPAPKTWPRATDRTCRYSSACGVVRHPAQRDAEVVPVRRQQQVVGI